MPETRLTQTIALLYQMEDADIRQLADQLLEARKRAWANALTDVAREHGCNRTPNAPRLQDLKELRRMCREDAANIARTYNREVSAKIDQLFDANRRGNRNYYFKNLERWVEQRNSWKLDQIALQTEVTTRSYARERFYRLNPLRGGRWRFIGPAPVCKVCARLYTLGFVDQATVDRNPAPVHIGCPHEWQQVQPQKANCAELWLG